MPGIALLGDVMLGRDVGRSVSPEALIHALDSVRSGRPLVVNLECCIESDSGDASRVAHSVFAASPRLVEALPRCGVVAASLANNHALDFGPGGLQSTGMRLRELGIAPLGLDDGAGNPTAWSTRVGTAHVTVLGCCALSLPRRTWRAGLVDGRHPDFVRAISSRASRGESVVVFVHWGHEGVSLPPPEARALACRFAAAGAAAVIGHGPHVAQGVETIDRTAVYYSLGDAVFDRGTVADRGWGVAALLDESPNGLRVEPLLFRIPAQLHVPQPTTDPNLRDAFDERSSILRDDAEYRQAFFAQAGHGFVRQQVRTTLRLVRKAGWRGLWEKARGLRLRHIRLLAHEVARLGR